MSAGRDFSIVFHINEHYKEMVNEINSIESYEEFSNSGTLRKAILLDLFQIGELFKQLSKGFKKKFDFKFSDDLIGIRNRIAHGYGAIKNDIIYDTIKNDIPNFIANLNDFSKDLYHNRLKKLLGKRVTVIVDRKINSVHKGITYKLNYGMIEIMTALDGEFQDAYIIDETSPCDVFEGYVVGIVHRLDDIEDKLLVSKVDKLYDKNLVEEQIGFQECFFKHTIIK